MWNYIRQLVGNGKAATIGIFAFIVILALLFAHKALSAEVDILAGSSFGTQGTGPVLGLGFAAPIQPGLNFVAGTDLWGSTTYHGETVPNNWDWHLGLQGCKWRLCGEIGPAFVQRVDAINGAHTNFYLGLSFKLSSRVSLALGHISDAGTSNPNVGRQALTLSYRLQ
jgi:Lipid A 3-O-deacylase (PagL)